MVTLLTVPTTASQPSSYWLSGGTRRDSSTTSPPSSPNCSGKLRRRESPERARCWKSPGSTFAGCSSDLARGGRQDRFGFHPRCSQHQRASSQHSSVATSRGTVVSRKGFQCVQCPV